MEYIGPVGAKTQKADEGSLELAAAGLGPKFFAYRVRYWLASPTPYLGLLGIVLFIVIWHLLTESLALPGFRKLPGPVVVWTEFVSRHPIYGVSIFAPDFYRDILWSMWRIFEAFVIATVLGVPLGLVMGWKKTFKDYTFPLIELLRPIPVLAWVPLAIVMWSGREAPIIFLAFLATFFATVLNTLLGVQSIDEVYFRAARCLGSKPRHIFFRVVLPGALPYVFMGLQIGMGVGWFSLVAAEMISGQHGLGYMVWNSFVLVQYPVIVIAMFTMGVIGYFYSTAIRIVGNMLMKWTVRDAR
jgi:sulfonate transport system permease protein